MDTHRDIRLLIRCAQMYYEEGMKQVDIGKQLGISKATVSRMLKQAKQNGIVTVKVENILPERHIEIERELENHFGLKEAIIVNIDNHNEVEIKKLLGFEGAKYLSRVINQNMIVGVSGGTTISKIAPNVINYRKNDITFVPLVGGTGQTNAELHSSNIALSLAKKYNAHGKILHAPSMVDNIENKKVFIEDNVIKSVLSLHKDLDIAVVGIGSVSSSSTMKLEGLFTDEEIYATKEKGAVGDICHRFINTNGSSNMFESNKRVIGIELNDLKKVPIVVGVSGNEYKSMAITAAMKAKLINVLITDSITAIKILKMKG